MKKLFFVTILLLSFCGSYKAQIINEKYGQKLENGSAFGAKIKSHEDGSLKFAIMSDIHITVGANSVEWTRQCVEDINKNPEIQFTIISGDIANFGSDEELVVAKEVLDNLKHPWFIIPGNHDATWSESGTNSFQKVFGYERFEFEAGGIKFLGTPCGPNIRMAPALIPKESMIWLEEQIEKMDPHQPLFFINHYPIDTSLLKYTQVIDLLKTRNIQLVQSGHWHQNRAIEYEGIPGVIIRSTQKDASREVGYVVVDVEGALISFREKIVGAKSPGHPWYSIRMSNGSAYSKEIEYPRFKNTFNEEYPMVKEIWRYENNADIGSAAAVYTPKGSGNILQTNDLKSFKYKGANILPYIDNSLGDKDLVIFADEAGYIRALDHKGSQVWQFKTDGKIFSSPAVYGESVVVGSSDNYIYCLNPRTGSVRWKYRCEKSVLGSANIYNGVVYIGASDGKFRAIDLKSGKLKWQYDRIKGSIVSRPFVDKQQVVIGDWANNLYSFDPKTGKIQWIWKTPRSLYNFAAAQVWPIKSNGKIIVVTPDRFSYQIDANSGKTLFSNYGGREAIGLSPDGYSYYIKSMKDTVKAISTIAVSQIVSATSAFGKNSAPASESSSSASVTGSSVASGTTLLTAPGTASNTEVAEVINSYTKEKVPASRVVWKSMPGYNYEIGPTPITSIEGVGKNNRGLLFIATDKGNIFALNVVDGSLAFKHNISGALVNYIMPLGTNQLLVSTMDGVVALLEYSVFIVN